jgi:hypothetical protein
MDWQSVELLAAVLPFGKVLFHQGNEACILGRFQQTGGQQNVPPTGSLRGIENSEPVQTVAIPLQS